MKTCFVTSFDGGYFDYSMVAVKTLGENYSGDSLDVVCLVPEDLAPRESEYVSRVNQPNLNISFRYSPRLKEIYYTDNSIIPNLQSWIENSVEAPYNIHCNHRIFMGSVLHDYDKAIYFDSDTIFMRDVSPMLNMKLRNKILALQEFSDINKEIFDDYDRPYFNNGVFITDLNFWRDQDLENKMIEWQCTNGMTPCCEQDAMNVVLIDHWSPLPASFNIFDYLLRINPVFKEHNPSPLLVHFVGPDKPWNGLESENAEKWRNKFNEINEL